MSRVSATVYSATLVHDLAADLQDARTEALVQRGFKREYIKTIHRLEAELARWRGEVEAHQTVEGPGWDTKQRCACGVEFHSRCELAFHQRDALFAHLAERQKEST